MFKNIFRLRTVIKTGLQVNVRQKSNSVDQIANVSVQGRFVCLELLNNENEGNKTLYKYPSIWLRDNCQCPKCYHGDSKSRVINWQDMKYDLEPKTIQVNGDDKLKIEWTDNHLSDFDIEWLQKRSFGSSDREKYLSEVYRPQQRLWNKNEFHDIIESFQYDDIINTKEGLKSWLKSLATNGCAFIYGAPHCETACRQVANLVGFIKKTHYGEEFIVRARATTNNAAYLSTPLQMHTDLPYYEYKPGVSLLHCLVQSKSAGAANLLVDGFYVAEKLKKEKPEYFRILTETLVNWSDYGVEEGNEFQKVYRAPVIRLDLEGRYNRITHSIPQRDSFFSISPEQADEWYKAMFVFVRMLYDEAVTFKTKPGDILTFSNIRLLHGRTGYTDAAGNTRHLVGAFIDWDEVYSRLRVLLEKD